MSRMSVAGTDVVLASNPATVNNKGNTYTTTAFSVKSTAVSNSSNTVDTVSVSTSGNSKTSSLSVSQVVDGKSIPGAITVVPSTQGNTTTIASVNSTTTSNVLDPASMDTISISTYSNSQSSSLTVNSKTNTGASVPGTISVSPSIKGQ